MSDTDIRSIIKTQLATPETCSQKVVGELRKALDLPLQDEGSDNRAGKSEGGAGRSRAASKPPSKAVAKASKPKLTSETARANNSGLSSKERYVLATESFNLCLNGIAAAIRERQGISKPSDALSHQEPSTLRPLSPNKKLNVTESNQSQQKPTPSAKSTSTATKDNSGAGLNAVIESGRAAFQYLAANLKYAQEAPKWKPWQLENGMLVFATRLTSLGLVDEALMDLGLLKRHLERQDVPLSKTASKAPSSSQNENSSILYLFDFAIPTVSDDDLNRLLLNHSMLVFRLALVKLYPTSLEQLLAKLDPANNNTFIARLLSLGENSVFSAEVLSKLDSLSQSLLKTASMLRSKDSKGNRNEANVRVRLKLQMRASTLRICWMERCGKMIDLRADLLPSIARHVSDFETNSSVSATEKWSLVRTLYDDLLKFLSSDAEATLRQDPGVILPLTRLAKSAGDSARAHDLANRLPNDAITETTKRLSLLSASVAAASSSQDLWQDSNEVVSIVKSLRKISEMPAGSLEILLKEFSHFRQVINNRLRDGTIQGVDDSTTPKSPVILLLHLFEAMIQLLGRQFVAHDGSVHQQRICHKICLTMISIVDTMLQAVRLNSELQTSILPNLGQAVSMILLELEPMIVKYRKDASSSDLLEQIETACVHLSDTSWMLLAQALPNKFVHEELKIGFAETTTAALSRLEPAIQKRASLASKLQKLGKLLLDSGKVSEAEAAFCESVKFVILSEDFSALMASRSLKDTIEMSKAASSVLKGIRAILEIRLLSKLRRPEVILPTHPEKIGPDLYGLLLEVQLMQICQHTAFKRSAESREMLNRIIGALNETYALSSYPLRRARFLSMAIQNVSRETDTDIVCLASEVSRELSEDLVSASNDSWLLPYCKYLKAALEISCQLECQKPDPLVLIRSTEDLRAILEHVQSESDIRAVVDNVETLSSLLESVAEFSSSLGLHSHAVRSLHLRLGIARIMGETPSTKSIIWELMLCEHMIYLGYSGQAESHLAKAKAQALAPDASAAVVLTLIGMELEIALAQLDMIRASACSAHLRKLLSDIFEASPSNHGSRSLRIEHVIASSDALQAQGKYFAETCDLFGRLKCQHHSVKLLESAFKGILRQSRTLMKKDNRQKDTHQGDGMHEETISESEHSPRPSKAGPMYWCLVRRLFRAYHNQAVTYDSLDMYQDVTNSLDDALKLAQEAGAEMLIAQTLVIKCHVLARSGFTHESHQELHRAKAIFDRFEESRELIDYHQVSADYFGLQRSWGNQMKSLGRAEATLDLLQKNAVFLEPADPSNDVAQTTQWLGKLKAAESAPTVSKSTAKAPKNRPSTREGTKSSKIPVEIESRRQSVAGTPRMANCRPLDDAKLAIRVSKADSLLRQDKPDEAQIHLSSIGEAVASAFVSDRRDVTHARNLLQRAVSDMSKHPVLSILCESTLAYPNVHEISNPQSSKRTNPAGPLRSTHTSARSEKQTGSARNIKTGLDDCLLQIVKLVSGVSQATQLSSGRSIRERAEVLSRSLLYILSGSLRSILQSMRQPISSTMVAYALETPDIYAAVAERHGVAVQTSDSLLKPSAIKLGVVTQVSPFDGFLSDESNLRSEVVEMMPAEWDIISIGIDELLEHLTFVKYRAREEPFVLRLPLKRHSDEPNLEPEDTALSYEDVIRELHEIVTHSDATVRRGQDESGTVRDTESKKKWWAEREDLNERLRVLLANIENMWLGGFRGILSQNRKHASLLSGFGGKFDKILDRHLPSRARGKQQRKIRLDTSIYEFFVNLATLDNDDLDMDEAVMDLLYFVVDILQFNGEENAYDEIDFDAMAVEVEDAQTAFQAAEECKQSSSAAHTILVIDKKLHCIPWESLPCLEGRSVSRVTSMVDLHERIKMIQCQQRTLESSEHLPGIINKRSEGTYVLNPSQDLHRTQRRFEQPLSILASEQGWSSIVNRCPTEGEFVSALSASNDTDGRTLENQEALASIYPSAMLYFGHGSGGQYIRPRAIKRLRLAPKIEKEIRPTPACGFLMPTCKTTLLFGCSSAHLEQHGHYNVSGTPITYMLAGAPAVLGSLWDVTDGDCDRLAAKTLEGWGLLDEGSCVIEEARKRGSRKKPAFNTNRKKSNKEEEDGKPEHLCLSEALAHARKECYLRYLNGAAMVVYGVPVYLQKEN